MAERWSDDHLRRSVGLVIATVIVFVVLGTGIYGDPIRQSVLQGLAFGVVYAVASYVYREHVKGRLL